MRVTPYFEGSNFDKFWSIPMGVLPLGLFSVLVFVVTSIASLVSIARKKQSPKNIVFIAVLPILVVGIYQVPFPSYVDGMHETLIESLSMEELRSFAADVRISNPKWIDRDEHRKLIKELRAKHPKSLSLSKLSPRVDVSDNYISVFYGSALVKHWGFVVGDLEKFPIEHIPENMYKEVYAGVWVYHDIW